MKPPVTCLFVLISVAVAVVHVQCTVCCDGETKHQTKIYNSRNVKLENGNALKVQCR